MSLSGLLLPATYFILHLVAGLAQPLQLEREALRPCHLWQCADRPVLITEKA